MISSFKHKGLRDFFESGSLRGINPAHARKMRMQLAALETAKVVQDLDLPGYDLHALRGDRAGKWAVSVSENWRITFSFIEGNASEVNYEDYH